MIYERYRGPNLICESRIGERRFSIIPNNGIYSSSEKFKYWKVDLPIDCVSSIEAPKDGARISADIAKYWTMPDNKCLVLVGDGVNFLNKPSDQMKGILVNMGCVDRPDALIPILINSSGFQDEILNSYELIEKPVDLFILIENYVQSKYREAGIDTSSLESADLPSMVGTAAIIDKKKISISTIGDHCNAYIDPSGGLNHIMPRQNIGIDMLTEKVINEMILNCVGVDVQQVTESRKFKEWIKFTYIQKMNSLGIVSVVNAKNFNPDECATMELPISWVCELMLGTDGISLGATDLDEELMEFSRSTALNYIGQDSLLSYIMHLKNKQKDRYKTKICTQEKKSDDIAGLHFKMKTTSQVKDWYRLFQLGQKKKTKNY